jgi:dienelactone hydrolase
MRAPSLLPVLALPLTLAALACEAPPDSNADLGGQALPDAPAPEAGPGAETEQPGPETAAEVGPDLPVGPQAPKPPEYTGGPTCPKLFAGPNSFPSWEKTRMVLFFLPDQPKGAPLLFLWHGLGDTAANFAQAMGAEAQAKKGLVVVVPQSQGSVSAWGFSNMDTAKPDAALFDDLLACTDLAFDIDNNRVYTMGFSAGALWSSWLVMHRSDYLAAAVVWSGGVGEYMNKWAEPTGYVPSLLAWGGAADVAGLGYNFEKLTGAFADKLKAAGQYVVTCEHGLGHTVPWSGPDWGLLFLTAHRWGEKPSPFLAKGNDGTFPKYCVFP